MGLQIPAYHKLQGAWAERRSRIMELVESGLTQSAIAQRLGITQGRVNQIVQEERRKARKAG